MTPLDPRPPSGPPALELIDGYLDRSLSAGDLARFERALESDANLRAELELQRRIDNSLGRLFAGAPPAPAAAIPVATPRKGLGGIPRWIPYAAAAAIALAGAGLWWTRTAPPAAPGPVIPRQARVPTLRGQYRSEVKSGFMPMAVCTTPEAFEAWVVQNYGRPLRPTSDPEGVEFVGWSYTNLISSYTGVLLARVDGVPVVVAMDKAEEETAPVAEGKGDEQIFRKEIGGLVLYEITPLAEARILPLLEAPG